MRTRIIELAYHRSSNKYFAPLAGTQHAVMLSSSAPLTAGRYDILTANPVEVIETQASDTAAGTIARIQAAVHRHTTAVESYDHLQCGLPFIAGAIGLLDYSAGEELAGMSARPDLRWPSVYAGIYQWALIQDHAALRSWLVADAKLDANAWQHLATQFSATSIEKTARGSAAPVRINDAFSLTSTWRASLDRSAYGAKFDCLQDYIKSGDCYQANLTREFVATYRGSPWRAFEFLQQQAPAPFSAYLRRPGATVISCSPERFIALHDGRAVTQPIKGTRPRSSDPLQDARLIAELAASEKDRAENLMIVDLMRNDFGKVCKIGSVSVPELFRVKSYSNVHHLVSTVSGQLPTQSPQAALDLLRACMPGGSVTGAPKRRAMEIIRELEPHARSIYCGTLFYLNRDGKMDSNILIRSLLFCENSNAGAIPQRTVHCWGGGGIVADSDCDDEFDESTYKVEHLLQALRSMGDSTQDL